MLNINICVSWITTKNFEKKRCKEKTNKFHLIFCCFSLWFIVHFFSYFFASMFVLEKCLNKQFTPSFHSFISYLSLFHSLAAELNSELLFYDFYCKKEPTDHLKLKWESCWRNIYFFSVEKKQLMKYKTLP